MKIGNFIKIETPGNISFEDDKLRVSTHNSITSILFEDISSLSVRYSSGVNMKYLILGLLCIFLGPTIISSTFSYEIIMDGIGGKFWDIIKNLFYLFGVILLIMSFVNRTKWDDVVVETNGGMLVIFSVLSGDGMKYLEEIESKKRMRN